MEMNEEEEKEYLAGSNATEWRLWTVSIGVRGSGCWWDKMHIYCHV